MKPTQFVITKIEGNPSRDHSADFFIQIDNQTRNRIPQYQPQKLFQIPREGFMRILCKEGDTFIGSVSFNCSLIPKNLISWIPLLTKPEDQIFQIPCMELASIWIQITPSMKLLTTVIQVPQPESTLQTEQSEDFMPEINLMSMRQSIKQEIKEEFDYNQLYLSEHKIRLQLEETVDQMNKQREQASEKQKQREEYLLQAIDSKDNQLLEAQTQNLKLKKVLEQTNNQLKESEDKVQALTLKSVQLSEASKEIEQLKLNLEQNQREKKKLQFQINRLSQVNENLKQQLSVELKKQEQKPLLNGSPLKKPTDRRPPITPNSSHRRLRSDPFHQHLNQQDPLDTLLKEKLKSLGRPDLLKKEQPNIYSCGRRKIFIDLKNNQIMCRIGGGFKPLQQYIQDYCTGTSLSVSSQRRQTPDSPINKSNSVQKSFYVKSTPKKREILRSKVMTPFRERKHLIQ